MRMEQEKGERRRKKSGEKERWKGRTESNDDSFQKKWRRKH